MEFRRSIGTLSLFMSAVGGIVGSGWLFGSLYAAQVAGPAAIIAWILGGGLMMVIAFTFAELATAFPLAGGMVQFAEISHGPLLSYTIGWLVWLSSVVVAPVETLGLIQYAANYIPHLVVKTGNTHVLTSLGILLAAVLMLAMTFLNLQGAKFFSRASTTIVAIKLIVPIVTLITLLHLDFHIRNLGTGQGFMPFGWHGIFAALPLGGIIFSFIGYSPAIQLAEEAKNPQRAIPIAIIGSIAFCIILYALLQLAFIGALKPSYFLNGWQHISFQGDNGPFAGILASLGVVWLVYVIYADAIISPFGTAFIYTASTARVNYAMTQTGFFPHYLQKLNKNGIPTRALIVNYFIGLLLFLPFPGWQSMVSFIISCFVISYSIGPIALIVLRRTQSDLQRPFRLPAAMVMAYLAFYICNLIIFWTGWQTVSKLLIALSIGAIILIYRYVSSEIIRSKIQWRCIIWLLPYCAGLGIISYLGTFGNGHGIIKFGIDFMIIAVFSLGIYLMAIYQDTLTFNRSITQKIEIL